MTIIVEAEVTELALIRTEPGGPLYHWSLFRDKVDEGGERGLKKIEPEAEENALWGAARHDWDMTKKIYDSWEDWRAAVNVQAQKRLDVYDEWKRQQ